MTEYIAENTAKWEQDRIEREQERNQAVHEWERKNRHEKIAVLREKWRRKENKPDEEKREESLEKHEREQDRWKIWRKKEIMETPTKTRESNVQTTPSSPHTPSPPPPRP